MTNELLWSFQWSQDCLAYLLRLISQFAVTQADPEQQGADEAIDSYESPRKKQRKGRGADRVLIPTLNKVGLDRVYSVVCAHGFIWWFSARKT